ncbi:MAG: hypothetical protein R2725_04945 [Solirubrobacterales bacterium]
MGNSTNPGGGALLCTQEELDEMCRNGTELVHEAIDTLDPALAKAEYLRISEARAGLVELMIEWTATTIQHVLETHGEAAMTRCFQPDFWLEIGQRTGLDAESTALARQVFADPTPSAARIEELVRAGDTAAAKRLWAEIDAATRRLHDYRIDWLSAVISHVYEAHGAEGLYGAMLCCAEAEWWHGRMEADLAELDDPVGRVRNWTFFLGVGNWGTVSVSETEEAFVIHHQVCGSCGSQELRGCLEEPLSLPRVTESIPSLNFGNPLYSAYRTHLAVWHFVMPVRDAGHPWPAIDCRGVPGRCWFHIYKDPHDTPQRFYDLAGLAKPARE